MRGPFFLIGLIIVLACLCIVSSNNGNAETRGKNAGVQDRSSEKHNLRTAARLNNEGVDLFQNAMVQAATKWQKAIETFYDYPIPHNNMAVFHYTRYMKEGMRNARDLEGAVLEWSKALRIDAEFLRARFCLAILHRTYADKINFRIENDRYMGLGPVIVPMNDTSDLRQQNLNIALNHYKIILNSAPDHADAHHDLGLLYEDMGRLDAAVKELSKAIALNKNYIVDHQHVARILEKQGKSKEAQGHRELIKKKFPDGVVLERTSPLTIPIKLDEQTVLETWSPESGSHPR